jgi:hypothetical protein
MKKYRKTIMIAILSISIVLINLFAVTRFNLAYGPFDWKMLSAAYPIPPVTLYLPFIPIN